jgi:adenylate cyclase
MAVLGLLAGETFLAHTARDAERSGLPVFVKREFEGYPGHPQLHGRGATGASPEVVEFLNGAFAFMIAAVDRHGGFINKFLGDGFMTVFGAPLDDHHAARHAVAAARDILAEIDRRGLGDGRWPLAVRAGPAMIGNVGSPRRKEFTAIGDTVNRAARLEQLNKESGSQLLVSDAVAARLDSLTGSATPLGDLPLKGYDAPVRV